MAARRSSYTGGFYVASDSMKVQKVQFAPFDQAERLAIAYRPAKDSAQADPAGARNAWAERPRALRPRCLAPAIARIRGDQVLCSLLAQNRLGR
jgi:hypothetical protein